MNVTLIDLIHIAIKLINIYIQFKKSIDGNNKIIMISLHNLITIIFYRINTAFCYNDGDDSYDRIDNHVDKRHTHILLYIYQCLIIWIINKCHDIIVIIILPIGHGEISQF